METLPTENADRRLAIGFVPKHFSANGLVLPFAALDMPEVDKALKAMLAVATPWRNGFMIDQRLAVLDDKTSSYISMLQNWADSSYTMYQYPWADDCDSFQSESPSCNQLVEEFENLGISEGYIIITDVDPEQETRYDLRCWWSDVPEARIIVEKLLADMGFNRIILSSSTYGHMSTTDKKIYKLCLGKKFKYNGITILIDR